MKARRRPLHMLGPPRMLSLAGLPVLLAAPDGKGV
jgi:hypothetical protein